MMKSMMIALAAILCFAPFSFGKNAAAGQAAGAAVLGHSTVIRALPSFLTVAFDRDHGRGGNGCGNQGGNGWDDGRDDRNRGGNNGGNCQSVPEGGSTLMYLFLASLACFGALLVQSLRKVAAHDQPAETVPTKRS